MVELADTRDLKSLGVTSVPVRPRLAAPAQKKALMSIFPAKREKYDSWAFSSLPNGTHYVGLPFGFLFYV